MRQILPMAIIVVLLAGVTQGQIINGPITGRMGPGGPMGKQATIGLIPDDPAQERDHMLQVCQERIQSARKAISENHWGSAVLDLNYGASYAIEPALLTEIRQLYQDCQNEGDRQLTLAKKDYAAENYLSAIKSFEVIFRTFGTLPCALQARAEMKAAQGDPKAKSAVNEAQAAGMNDFLEATIASAMRTTTQPTTSPGATTTPTTSPADLSPATAPAALSRADKIKLLDIPRRVRVVDTLERLAKLCPLAPTGKAALRDLEELQNDDSFWSTIKTYRDEKIIEQAFKKAELYEKQGLLPKAKEFYEQLAADYPQHPLGQRAHLAALGIGMDQKAHATSAPSGR